MSDGIDYDELLNESAQTMETEDGEVLVIELDEVKRLISIAKTESQLKYIDTVIDTYREWGSLDDRFHKSDLYASRIRLNAKLSELMGVINE